MITLIIPGQPRGKARARVYQNKYTGKTNAVTPQMTVEYENYIKWAFVQSGQQKIEGNLKLTIKAYYEVPKSYSKKRKAACLAGEVRPIVKPDIDNILKICADAMNKLCYSDDSTIVEMHGYKYYDENPRVEIFLTDTLA